MIADKIRVQFAMARSCMSLEDIAQAAQMPKSTVKKAVSGQSVLPVTLGKIARALGVDVTDLLHEGEARV